MSAKKKFYFGVIIFIILVLLSFMMSFQKAIKEYRKFKGAEEIMDNNLQHNGNIKEFKAAISIMDSILREKSYDGAYNEYLLGKIGEYCHDNELALYDFSTPHEWNSDTINLFTQPVILKGRFKEMLSFIYYLEGGIGRGIITAAEIIKEKDYKNNNYELFLKIYIQYDNRQS